MTDRRGRRAVIAAGATLMGALAGCTWKRDTKPDSTVEPAAIPDILAEPVPTVRPSAPVLPAADTYRTARARAMTLLDELRGSIAQNDVPNGVVRENIDDHRSQAREHIDTASIAGKRRYYAYIDTIEARAEARQAATVREAVNRYRQDRLTELAAALRTEHSTAESTLRPVIERVAYTGPSDGPGRNRALAIYATAERALGSAVRRLSEWELGERATVIDLGEAAATLESAQATADVWGHLLEQYTDERAGRESLRPAGEAAITATRQRLAEIDLPSRDADDWVDALVDREIEENGLRFQALYESITPVWRARNDLQEAASATPMVLGEGLAAALRVEQEYRAFDRVRERVLTELTPGVDEEALRAERTAALEAARTAAEAIPGPSMARNRLAKTVRAITYTDGSLELGTDSSRSGVKSVRNEYLGYVCLRARLSALSAAAAALRDRFDAA